MFLTPTGLPNAAANEFYTTGAVAGIYRADADGFVRSSHDEDSLPEILTLKDLEQFCDSVLFGQRWKRTDGVGWAIEVGLTRRDLALEAAERLWATRSAATQMLRA